MICCYREARTVGPGRRLIFNRVGGVPSQFRPRHDQGPDDAVRPPVWAARRALTAAKPATAAVEKAADASIPLSASDVHI